ncbi:ParB/RepB/Spo0J family partition protein [Timonella sp. A28]|uniref:ParB/RepB/Spo0J family partition protein n=1 Tax=Timonella sp. A28 TaxID=3442640 RepID=UPI003EB6F87B
MAEKKRGLGKGLGALIPTAPEVDRPVDVFFPDQNQGEKTAPRDTLLSTGARELLTAPPRKRGGHETHGVDAVGRNPGTSERTAKSPSDSEVSARYQEESKARTEPVLKERAPRRALTLEAEPDLVPVPGATFAELPVGLIKPNPKQPRTIFDEDELAELVDSIKEIGVLQPVVVRAVADGFELIMGERRWRATQEAGLSSIPAIIRETEDQDLLRDALLENLHRSALNPLEEAAAYRQLLDDFGCTHEELAMRIARSRPQISNTLRLLNLPPLVQRRVAAGVLSAGHARALLGLTDHTDIERLAQRIVAEGLSVRATEEAVALGSEKPSVQKSRAVRAERNAAADELAGRLSDRFETRVKVDFGKSKGKLTVEFATVDDLNRILAVMAPEESGFTDSDN